MTTDVICLESDCAYRAHNKTCRRTQITLKMLQCMNYKK